MTEWTSLSVTKDQRKKIKAEKPEGMPMGEFLVDAIVEGEVSIQQVDVDGVVDGIVHELEMGGTPESDIEELVSELKGEIKKCQEIAEQARDNTDTITEGMGR